MVGPNTGRGSSNASSETRSSKTSFEAEKRINTEASFETERKMATPTLDEYGTNLTRLAQEVCTFFLDLLLGNAMDNALRSNW
jgi:hypothetical protein